MKKEVLDIYNEIFEELEKEAKKNGVSESNYASKNYILNGIKDLTSIPTLKNRKLSAEIFKTKELQKIIDYTPPPPPVPPVIPGEPPVAPPVVTKKRKSATYHLAKGISTIRTDEELNAYIEKIRKEMTQLLNDDKTIILK